MRSHRRLLVPIVAAALLCACAPDPAPDGVPRLIVVGVDAACWELLAPLLDAGELPHLAALRDRGVSAELTTVEPLISPPNWTSIATGRTPAAHGVTSFFQDRRAIRVPTVWERLAAAGVRVGLYDYLITWPPRSLPDGFVIPGWLRRDERVWPPDVFERIGLPRYAYEVVDVGGVERVIANLEREVRDKPRYFNRLVEEFDLDVGVTVFYAVDVASHILTPPLDERALPPASPAVRFRDAFPRLLRGVDAALGEVAAGAGAGANVVVVSDHGTGPAAEVSRKWGYDNAWLLERAGAVAEGDGAVSVSGFLSSSFAVADEATLARLSAFFGDARAAGGEPLFSVWTVRDPAQPGADTPAWQLEMIATRPAAYGFVFAVGVAETFDRLWPDGEAVIGGERAALADFAQPHDFTGDHTPLGLFVGAGPAFRHLAARQRLSVLDVASLITYLAGQPLAEDLEGGIADSWLDPDYLARHPRRHIAAADAPTLPPEDDEAPAGDDEDVRRRLRALGYVQ